MGSRSCRWAELSIAVKMTGATLDLRITNPTAPTRATTEGGVGLVNARERLRLLFGEGARAHPADGPMKALLVDDERLARAELRRLLGELPEVAIVGEAANADDAVAEIGRLDPEIVFLDIELPGATGFDVLGRLERVPLVVFTTAYDEHAVRAFEVSALDYLLKPVEPRRLHAAVEKARVRLAATTAHRQLPPGGFLERAFVRDGAFCLVVEFREVTLFESEGNYTRLHLDGPNAGQTPLLARSLNYLEERLDPGAFFRANRKELVTLTKITRFEPDGTGLLLRMKNGREVEMSRRQAQRFRQIMSA